MSTLHIDIARVNDAQELYDGLACIVARQKVICELNIKVKYVAMRCRIKGYVLDAVIMEDLQQHIVTKENKLPFVLDNGEMWVGNVNYIPF